MGAPRLRKVSSDKELESIVDDYVTQGYTIQSRGETSVRVKKKDYGTLGMHILFGFFTLGIGNAIYVLVKMSGADEVHLKLEDS